MASTSTNDYLFKTHYYTYPWCPTLVRNPHTGLRKQARLGEKLWKLLEEEYVVNPLCTYEIPNI